MPKRPKTAPRLSEPNSDDLALDETEPIEVDLATGEILPGEEETFVEDEPAEADLEEIEFEEEEEDEDREPLEWSAELADDPVRMYLKEIGQVRLLDVDQEVWFATQMNAVEHLRQIEDRAREKLHREPAETDVMREIYANLQASWKGVEKASRKTHARKPNLAALAGEVRTLRTNPGMNNPPTLRPYIGNGRVERVAGWTELTGTLFDVYALLYLMPIETLDWLFERLRKRRTLPDTRSFLKSLPGAHLIRESFQMLAEHSERAKQSLIRANLRQFVPRPDPGRQHRLAARRREVRSHARLQVQHVRHVVDPPGDQPRHRRPGPHHPHPRSHGRDDQPSAAGAARADAGAGSRSHGR